MTLWLIAHLDHEPLVVRVEALRIAGLQLLSRPPAGFGELAQIRCQRHSAPSDQQEPQTDIGMAMILAHRPGDSDEARLPGRVREDRLNTELLAGFTPGGIGRVFIWFHMPPGWKPQTGVDVIHEQRAPVVRVEQDDVRDQVLIGDGRLDPPEHVVCALEPAQGGVQVLSLQRVPGMDTADQVMHHFD